MGKRGYCGATDEVSLARAALHYWEEPPISGERGSGTLFFVGCPLKCVYCQNRDIAEGKFGSTVSVGRLADICLELQGQGALNVNCVTPTHYSTEIAKAIDIARNRGLTIPVVWNTSGYERTQIIEWLSDTVDVYLTDFKYCSADIAKAYSNAPDYPAMALEALSRMIDTAGSETYDIVDGMQRMRRGVVVRHLLLPGGLEDSKNVLSLLYSHFGNDVKYSIMNQYTPVMKESELTRFPELSCCADPEDYERLLDFADGLGIDDYFWQEGPAARESFIPVWDGTGVEGASE